MAYFFDRFLGFFRSTVAYFYVSVCIQDLILNNILNNKLELVWSFVLDYENNANPYEERRLGILIWKDISVADCDLNDEIANKARDLMLIGLRQKDASHIACAIYENADYFITTDKKILNKPVTQIQLINPIDFVRRYLDE